MRLSKLSRESTEATTDQTSTKISAKGRARIAAAQRARWAKVKGIAEGPAKRMMSVAARVRARKHSVRGGPRLSWVVPQDVLEKLKRVEKRFTVLGVQPADLEFRAAGWRESAIERRGRPQTKTPQTRFEPGEVFRSNKRDFRADIGEGEVSARCTN